MFFQPPKYSSLPSYETLLPVAEKMVSPSPSPSPPPSRSPDQIIAQTENTNPVVTGPSVNPHLNLTWNPLTWKLPEDVERILNTAFRLAPLPAMLLYMFTKGMTRVECGDPKTFGLLMGIWGVIFSTTVAREYDYIRNKTRESTLYNIRKDLVLSYFSIFCVGTTSLLLAPACG